MLLDSKEFSAAPIAEDQLVAWPRVAAISAMVGFSIPTFLIGLEVSAGLTPQKALIAFAVGAIVCFFIGAAMGVVGSRTRLNSYLLVKIAFGDFGAGIVNIAFALSLLGWFGVNINLFTDALGRLIEAQGGTPPPPFVMDVIASAVMTLTTIVGFRAINMLSLLLVPPLVVVTGMLVVFALETTTLQEVLTLKTEETMTLGEGISIVVGGIIVGLIIMPDTTRFITSWPGAIYTSGFAYLGVQFVVLLAAGLAGIVAGMTDILEVMVALKLGIGAFILVIASSWILNSLNLYSTALGVKATFPRLNDLVLIVGLGTVGVVAALMNILDKYEVFLFYLSIIFVPVAGVIVIDYYFIRKGRYTAETLASNRTFNLAAIASWGVGSIVAILAAQGELPTLSGIPAVDSMALSGGLYLLFTWKGRERPRA